MLVKVSEIWVFVLGLDCNVLDHAVELGEHKGYVHDPALHVERPDEVMRAQFKRTTCEV